MRKPRILLTNQVLSGRTGTEMYLRDLAPQLLRRGWRPVVYTPQPGGLAEELRRLTIPVVDRLDRLSDPPDLIHGHHNHPTLAALSHFPTAPAVLFCHDWDAWHDEPFQHPRVLRYVAVDEACRDRLVCLGGTPKERVELVPNWADTGRFRPRAPLPDRPQRALLFSNQQASGRRCPFREACRAEGVAFTAVGRGRSEIDRPEEALGEYDLVFAKGKSALEALAVGTAVVLAGYDRIGPMVASDRLDELRANNFGRRVIDRAATTESVRQEITRYDAGDARAVSLRVREESGLDVIVDRLTNLYEEVLAEHATAAVPDPAAESRAVAAYLERTQMMVEYGAKRWRRKQRDAELREAGPLERLRHWIGRAA